MAGCGDDDGLPAGGGGAEPGEGGTLVGALDGPAREVDPLYARTRAERVVTRQIFEPLVERVAGPFGDSPGVGGLALRARPTRDPTIWRVVLRPGVRFQDGSRLNATAVLENVDRWLASRAGRRLLPSLTAADAPRPHLLRFILAAPDPALGERLGSPRLGLVSPRALAGGRPAARRSRVDGDDAGTGPFELREHDAGRLLLARNTSWWGSELDLGPALAQVELRSGLAPSRRAELLAGGDVQVADGLGPAETAALQTDPLVLALPQGERRWRGIERSVRGIDSGGRAPSLQSVWLTTLR
ncbi:MAG TPA: ABC transporter substrate-binding protein [Solirubrobacterales bacterium]|nr:ABC transporter substrate-binding protein [Solirubrobacterales bacterium]